MDEQRFNIDNLHFSARCILSYTHAHAHAQSRAINCDALVNSLSEFVCLCDMCVFILIWQSPNRKEAPHLTWPIRYRCHCFKTSHKREADFLFWFICMKLRICWLFSLYRFFCLSVFVVAAVAVAVVVIECVCFFSLSLNILSAYLW